jgi:biotin synthase
VHWTLGSTEIARWLTETNTAALEELYREADRTRRSYVGDQVHLRGLIEISNVCSRLCGYCGLRADNRGLVRYQMADAEILAAARQAAVLGYGSTVLQAGESEALGVEFIAGIVRKIKAETPLAVTLSLGERSPADLERWREAGADRYLLRFETSDPELFRRIHPAAPGKSSDRIELLHVLRALGYEIGSGVMVGIPGQSYAALARDIELFRELDLDMIGVGPFLPHPATPLGCGDAPSAVPPEAQVPNTEEMTYKVVALTRLVCPEANIPSTTALATVNSLNGRELGLMRGANVVMPNLTPPAYRRHYEIYPNKACLAEQPADCSGCLRQRIARIGRVPGAGPGGRQRGQARV